MPLIDHVKLYGEDVSKVLQPGERLLAMGFFTSDLGDKERLPDHDGPLPSDKFFLGFKLLAGGLRTNPHRFDRFFFGVSGIGGRSTIAGQFFRVTEDTRISPHYAVTDRRLLLLHEEKTGSGDYRIVFETPRSTVASAARRGRLFQRGRVELTFTDGSMKALTTGMLFTGRARQLVRALHTPTTSTGA